MTCLTLAKSIGIEGRLFKTNHAVVGCYITRSWKLPLCEHICACHRVLGGQPEGHECCGIGRVERCAKYLLIATVASALPLATARDARLKQAGRG